MKKGKTVDEPYMHLVAVSNNSKVKVFLNGTQIKDKNFQVELWGKKKFKFLEAKQSLRQAVEGLKKGYVPEEYTHNYFKDIFIGYAKAIDDVLKLLGGE